MPLMSFNGIMVTIISKFPNCYTNTYLHYNKSYEQLA